MKSRHVTRALSGAVVAVALLFLALGLAVGSNQQALFAAQDALFAPDPGQGSAQLSVISAQTTTTTTTYLYLPALIQGSATSTPGETLTPEERMAAIDGMDTILNANIDVSLPFAQRNPVTELEQVAAKLIEAPNVMTVLLYTQTLTIQAILDDGFSILINNNRPPGAESLPGTRLINPAGPDAIADNVPKKGRAVAQAFDGGESVASAVAATLSGRSYTLASLGTSVEAMKNYRDLGALYLDTHGTGWTEVLGVQVDENGTKRPVMGNSTYALQTSSQVAATTFESTYKEDLAQGRLTVQFTELNGRMQAKLAVTDKFIRHYWKLDGAIVMIHACFSGSGQFTSEGECFGACNQQELAVFDPRPIRQAILAAGANVVVGFDNYTNATMAEKNILFFFDRLVGANVNEPTTPPTRPFLFIDVWGQMSKENRLTFNKPAWVGPFGLSVGGNMVNMTFDAKNSSTALAPSIRYVDVTDDADKGSGKLEIYGSFGETMGKVEVDGTDIPVTSWSKTKIEATAPFEGLGSRGYLVVKAPDNVPSNSIPFTDWFGSLTYTLNPGQGNLDARTKLDVHFRADVHSYRETIDGPLTDRPAVDAYLNGASKATIQASGSHTDNDSTVTWSGNAPLSLFGKTAIDTWIQGGRNGLAPQANGGNFGGVITVDAKNRKARLCLVIMAEFTQTITSTDGSYTIPGSLTLLGESGPADNTRGLLTCYNLTMNEDYSLAAGSRQITLDGATLRISWTTFTPFAPPTDRTPS